MNSKIPYIPSFRAFCAVIAWVTLITQYGLVVSSHEHSNIITATVSYLSYFTILTNFLVALAFTAPLSAPTTKLYKFFTKPAVRGAIALYITFVAVVYHLMLRNLWDPQGVQLATDIALHTVLPILYLLDWILIAPKRPLRYTHIPYWVVYPAAYGLFTILRGALSGVYPYPFLNVTELGLGGVLVNMTGFMALYAIGGAIFITLGHRIPNPLSMKPH